LILKRIQRGIVRNQSKGHASNILLHDGGDRALAANRIPTVEATRQLLEESRGTDRRFVTPADWI
jgi:hypothetical protein